MQAGSNIRGVCLRSPPSYTRSTIIVRREASQTTGEMLDLILDRFDAHDDEGSRDLFLGLSRYSCPSRQRVECQSRPRQPGGRSWARWAHVMTFGYKSKLDTYLSYVFSRIAVICTLCLGAVVSARNMPSRPSECPVKVKFELQ